MSQQKNAPYNDRILDDGVTIEYEGHDVSKLYARNPKRVDQAGVLPTGKLTENGKFVRAVEMYKAGEQPETIRAYEKIRDGIWSFKGTFDLIDYRIVEHGGRKVFRFFLRLNEKAEENLPSDSMDLTQTRLIPTSVKQLVWKRDKGQCVECGSRDNLHFDHDLPFSEGGTSISEKNIKLLCMRHNLQKGAKII